MAPTSSRTNLCLHEQEALMNGILVATDGSRSGTAAVDAGLDLAKRLGVDLTFVSVHRAPPRTLGDPFYEANVGLRIRQAYAAVEDALARAAAIGVEADGDVLEGGAADEIVAFADNNDSSLVVIGSRGRGPFVGASLGSVSAGVVHQARRPVVVVNACPVKRKVTRAA
jgi:nucleotide-binding universal stress UspA family protein